MTVTFALISPTEDVEGETVRIGADDYLIVDATSTTYSDAVLGSERHIYVKGSQIKDGAFKNCTKIQYVYLSDSNTRIGSNAFEGCTSLYYVNAPNVSSIGDYAFKNSGIDSLSVGSSLTSIGRYAFQGADGLRYLPLWNTSVTELKEGTFQNCGLKLVDLRNITTIHSTAFSGSEMDLQLVRTGQTVVVPGICRLYCDLEDPFGDDGPLKSIWKSGTRVTMLLKDQLYLSIKPTSGGVDPTVYSKGTFDYRAEFSADAQVDYEIDTRKAEIRFPDDMGVDAVVEVEVSELPYAMPVPTLGTLAFYGWKAEGVDGYIASVDRETMNKFNGILTVTAEFGSADLTMDHSSIADRTDVSSLPTRLGFTYGDSYVRMPDVVGYRHVGWMVDGALVDADAVIATYGSHTASSVWEPTVKYRITYNDRDGSEISSVEAAYNETVTPDTTIAVTEAVDERFAGWSADGISVSATVRADRDMSLTPMFDKRTAFNVSVVDRGETISETTVYDGRTYAFEASDPYSPTQIFLGWSDGLSSGDVLTVSCDLAIESEWRDRVAYTVTYMDGRTVLGTQTALEGVDMTVTADDPTVRGKRFAGWIAEDGTRFMQGDAVSVGSDIALTADWTALPLYTVTVIDGSEVRDSVDLYEGETYAFACDVPSRDGKIFVGWMMSGEMIGTGHSFTVSSSVAIAAEWRDPYIYAVEFDDGHGWSDIRRVTEGDSMTVDVPNPVSDDCIFTSWSGSDGRTYSYGDTVAPGSDMTLTAQWRDRAAYAVTYIDGDAIVSDEAREGVPYTVSPDIPVREGYRFAGWDADGTTVSAGDSIDVAGDIVLTSAWEARTVFTVTYIDGDEIVATATGYEGDVHVMSEGALSEEGRVFVSWSIGDDSVSEGDEIVLDSDIVIRANWRAPDEYTVRFMDGDRELYARTVGEGGSLAIDVRDPVSESRVFVKWTDGSRSYLSGDSVAVTGDMVLTAVWEDKERFAVKFLDGLTVVSSVTAYDGSKVRIDAEDPVSEGKAFAGWLCDGNLYSKGGYLTVVGDMVLTAQWRDLGTYAVTFHSEGKVVGAKEFAEGGSVILDWKVSRDGYEFKGWAYLPDGPVMKRNGDTISPNGDLALYAVWESVPDAPGTDHDGSGSDGKDDGEGPDGDGSGSGDGGSDVGDEVDGFLRGFGLNPSTVAIAIGIGAMVTAMMAVALRRS